MEDPRLFGSNLTQFWKKYKQKNLVARKGRSYDQNSLFTLILKYEWFKGTNTKTMGENDQKKYLQNAKISFDTIYYFEKKLPF